MYLQCGYMGGASRPYVFHQPPDRSPQEYFGLARTIHEASAAAADPGMSAALRSVGFLDVLVDACSEAAGTPAEFSLRTPCIHARLHRLATKPHE
jgi:hypothetical protein